MKSAIGRLLTLAGAAIVIFSLFIPVIQMEFEVPAQKLGDIVLKPRPVKVESSLYELGDKLSDLEGVKLPEILDFLWLIFMVLAIINALLAIKPSSPRIFRAFIGILPLAFLVIVVWQTAVNPDLAIGYEGLFEYFMKGFYILLAGTVVLFIGSLMTGGKKKSRRNRA